MFTEKEIALMQKIGLNLNFEHLEVFTDDEWIHISDVVEDYYLVHGLRAVNDDYQATSDGTICEDILEKLARMD